MAKSKGGAKPGEDKGSPKLLRGGKRGAVLESAAEKGNSGGKDDAKPADVPAPAPNQPAAVPQAPVQDIAAPDNQEQPGPPGPPDDDEPGAMTWLIQLKALSNTTENPKRGRVDNALAYEITKAHAAEKGLRMFSHSTSGRHMSGLRSLRAAMTEVARTNKLHPTAYDEIAADPLISEVLSRARMQHEGLDLADVLRLMASMDGWKRPQDKDGATRKTKHSDDSRRDSRRGARRRHRDSASSRSHRRRHRDRSESGSDNQSAASSRSSSDDRSLSDSRESRERHHHGRDRSKAKRSKRSKDDSADVLRELTAAMTKGFKNLERMVSKQAASTASDGKRAGGKSNSDDDDA